MNLIYLLFSVSSIVMTISLVYILYLLNKEKVRRGQGLEDLQSSLKADLTDHLHNSFRESIESLSTITNEKLDTTTTKSVELMEGKSVKIENGLAVVGKTLDKLSETVSKFDRESEIKLTRLTSDISKVNDQTTSLSTVTDSLNKTLSSGQSRGQWGERMVEDILNSIGFVENINYKKQQTSESDEDGRQGRPDYTFLLPKNLVLNMDVKFPLENYSKYLSEATAENKEIHKNAFIKDIKGHINGLAERNYIDPENGTVDCLLMFIPNEGIFQFVNKESSELAELALSKKIVICSPLSIFPVLSIIRQSIDNFAVTRASSEIMDVISEFRKQSTKFSQDLEKASKQLETFTRSFNSVKTTRQNQMDKVLNKVDRLKNADNYREIQTSGGDKLIATEIEQVA